MRYAQRKLEKLKLTNPLAAWAEEELIEGPGAYVGVHMDMGVKGDQEVGRRRPLYPAHERWCKRFGYLPFSGRRFSQDLLYYVLQRGIKFSGFIKGKEHT